MRALSLNTELHPTSKNLWWRTSWPEDALNFNARFLGWFSVNGTWVLEVCIYVSNGKVFLIWSRHEPGEFSGVFSWDASIPKAKPSVWDVSIGSEYFVLFAIKLFLTVFFSIKHITIYTVYYLYITGVLENMIWIDLKNFYIILVHFSITCIMMYAQF